MDLNRIPSTTHGHEFHNGLSRVVMVRKTEQRTFASGKDGEEPKFETVTRETVETYRGNRPDRVTTSEKRDVLQNLPGEFRKVLQEDQNVTTNTVTKNVVVKEKLKSRSPSVSPDRLNGAKQRQNRRQKMMQQVLKVTLQVTVLRHTMNIERNMEFHH